MKAILINNLNRLIAKKGLVFAMIFLNIIAISAALFFSGHSDVLAKVAIVSDDHSYMANEQLGITYLDRIPSSDVLLMGKYDAVLTSADDGALKLISFKDESTQQLIMGLLSGLEIPENMLPAVRSTGSTIMGFLLMFLLMESSMFMCLFAEDQEHQQLTRITIAPVSIKTYILAQCLFNFLCLYVPSLLLLYGIHFATGLSIGFSFLQYAFIFALVCAMGTAYSLLLNACIKSGDSANMIGSATIVLTSILAGSFYSFDQNNQVLSAITRVLPQKALINITDLMDTSFLSTRMMPYLVYIILLTAACFTIASLKTKHEYINKK